MDSVLENTGERLIPEFSDPGTLAYHLARYQWAKEFAVEKEVLDAGCGLGYGSAMLADVAHHVTAVDVEQSAIEYAEGKYGGDNLDFSVMDCTDLTFRDGSFDLIVSFEVFEHIPDGESFCGELRRVLKTSGVLLISTPNARTWNLLKDQADNPYHINMVTPEQFGEVLNKHFNQVDVYGMRKKGSTLYSLLRGLDILNLRLRLPFAQVKRMLTTTIGGSDETALQSADIIISQGQIRQCHTLVATCKKF